MTASEAINVLIWPGHLGDLLLCSARLVPAQATPTESHHAAIDRYRAGFDAYKRPWLEVYVHMRRPGCKAEARSYGFLVPESATAADVVRDVHAAAMWLLQQELYSSAGVMVGREKAPVWDATTLPVCPDQSRHAPAEWVGSP
jgi:hypothetical protein